MDLDTIQQVLVARNRGDLGVLTRPGTSVLAGGTALYAEPQDHLDRLVDITALGWPARAETDAGLEIAATCTLAEFAGAEPGHELGRRRTHPDRPGTELFAWSCRALLASHKIWRTATVGGNICLALPAGAVLGALTALDGVALVWQPDGGARAVPLRDFVLGPGHTVLVPGEVLRSVTVPITALRARVAAAKIAAAPLGRSGTVVFGRVERDGRCALTVCAATTRPVVLDFPVRPEPDEVRARLDALDPALWFDDPHGTPDWRRHTAGVLAGTVLRKLGGGA